LPSAVGVVDAAHEAVDDRGRLFVRHLERILGAGLLLDATQASSTKGATRPLRLIVAHTTRCAGGADEGKGRTLVTAQLQR
jgi:hypothetical protein